MKRALNKMNIKIVPRFCKICFFGIKQIRRAVNDCYEFTDSPAHSVMPKHEIRFLW